MLRTVEHLRRIARGFLNAKGISAKLSVIIGLVGLAAFASIALIISVSIHQKFSEIERSDINASIARANAGLQNLGIVVEKKVADWGLWTESYEYIENANQKFLNVNVHAAEAKAAGVDGIGYFRFDKQPRAVVYYNRDDGKLIPDMVRRLRALGGSDAMIARARARTRTVFFARAGDRVLAVAMVPVTRSDGSGTPSGYVLMAFQVNAATLSEALQVATTLDTHGGDAYGFRFASNDRIDYRIPVPGLDGTPVAAVTYSQHRAMMQASRELVVTMIGSLAWLILLMLLTLSVVLNRSMVTPLLALKQHVDTIGDTGELTDIAHDGRRDEIGALASGFNAMLAQLRDLRARMEAQSFQIGKSQSAIGSLHNVRNGLCPVTTLLSLLPQDLEFPTRAYVVRALAELANDDLTPERRQQLAAFVTAAIDRNAEQFEAALAKVYEAHRAVAQVAETISAEQASLSSTEERTVCNLTAVVSASLAIATYNGKGCAITVDYADDHKRVVQGDRVLIAQVVGNVLTNSVEAIAAAKRSQGHIRIAGSTVAVDGRTMESITISDNGDGFDPARTQDLFVRGFSTRRDKRGGLGLHWCANTINAMGGTLTISSDGPGTGATTTILLPSAEAAIANNAAPAVERTAKAA